MKFFINLTTAIFFLNLTSIAQATDINTPFDDVVVLSPSNPTLNLQPGGELTNVVFGVLSNNLVININASNNDQGISVVNSAIETMSASVDINLNVGKILSNGTTSGEARGTVLLINAVTGVNNINLSSGTSVQSTALAGFAVNYINYVDDATLNINNAGTISSTTNSDAQTIRFYDTSSGSTLNVSNSGLIDAGSGKAINIMNSNLANITSSGTIIGEVNLGGNAASNLNLTGGSMTGNLIFGNSAQVTAISNEVNLTGDIIGGGQINISSNAVFNLDSNATAANINLQGELNLNKTSGSNLVGTVVGSGSASLNLNAATHNLTGNLTLVAGDSLSTAILNQNTAGAIIVNGSASIDSGSALNVKLGANSTAVGAKYVIVSAADATNLNKLNVNVDGSSSSRSGIYVFSTELLGNDLVLEVSRYKVAELTISNNSQIYDAITEVTAPSGELMELQQYLDSDVNSTNQKIVVLDSVQSQLDNSHNRVSFNNSDLAANLISQRLETVRSGVPSGDNQLSKSIWAEIFGGSAKQGNRNGYEGYNAASSGFSVGIDKNFEELTLGVAATYAHSNVKSISGTKTTAIDNYQINFYSGGDYEKYFVNMMLGVGYNKYDSVRRINLVQSNARAAYQGYSYVARAEIGTKKSFKNNVIFTPSFLITAAKNTVDSYREEGAGTLDLNVKNDSANFFETRLATKISKDFLMKKNIFTPALMLSYGYDFAGDRQKTTANFVGQTASFASDAARIAQGSWKIGAGLKIYNFYDVSLNAEYNFEHRSHYDAHLGSVRMKYNF